MKRTTTFFLLIFFALYSIAQTGSIQGKVTDENTGEIIFGANVYVKDKGKMLGSFTDPDGKYKIKPLDPGTYNLHISYQGKVKVLPGVEVHTNNISFVNYELNPSIDMDPYIVEELIDPVIIPDNPSMSKINSLDIKNDPNNKNLSDLIISHTPGIIKQPGDDRLIVRGSRPNSTQYIIDGVKSRSGNLNIPGMAVGNINVYTGGIPAKYGDVTGGVIIVDTKSYYDLVREKNLEEK